MEPIPGAEREGAFDPDEDIPPQHQDDGTEGDPDLGDEQKSAIPVFVPEGTDIPKSWRKEARKVSGTKNSIPSAKSLAVTAPMVNHGLDRIVDSAFEQAVVTRMELYRCDALDALHDLAMMRIYKKQPALMNIKYLAACRLAGTTEGGGKGPDLHTILASLNEAFHKNATRIKEVRERVITFDDSNASPVTLTG